MARRCSQVRVGIDPKPPITPPEDVEPDRTMRRFVPMAEKTLSTRAFAPSPTATMEMTDATPITTPRAVKSERLLFLRRARKASGKVWPRFMRLTLLSRRGQPASPLAAYRIECGRL